MAEEPFHNKAETSTHRCFTQMRGEKMECVFVARCCKQYKQSEGGRVLFQHHKWEATLFGTQRCCKHGLIPQHQCCSCGCVGGNLQPGPSGWEEERKTQPGYDQDIILQNPSPVFTCAVCSTLQYRILFPESYSSEQLKFVPERKTASSICGNWSVNHPLSFSLLVV